MPCQLLEDERPCEDRKSVNSATSFSTASADILELTKNCCPDSPGPISLTACGGRACTRSANRLAEPSRLTPDPRLGSQSRQRHNWTPKEPN
eukprot:1485555-Pyramimonas_sp.AAC.2